ncbi:MFS transporter [Halobacillus salinus]|nr:MFS transporter [Halobacillus salinus]
MSLKGNRKFKIVFMLGTFTNIGDSLFFIITMWYMANQSEFALVAGVAGFLFTLPEALLIFTGPLIDRTNPKRILFLAAFFQLVVHSSLIFLFVTGLDSPLNLLPLIFVSACCSAITYPVEETVLPKIVEEKDLIRANSLFSIAYKLSDSLFDSVAGILLIIGSVTLLYGINLVIFLIPFLLLRLFRFFYKTEEGSFEVESYKKDLKKGVSFVMGSTLKWILFPLAIVNFFTAMNLVALPFFSNQLAASPSTYGFLLSASGLGSMVGALLIATGAEKVKPGVALTLGLFFHGVLWLFVVFSPNVLVACCFIFLANLCMGAYNVVYASLFQSITPKHLLGRVNTAVDSVITVAMPFGALTAGLIMEWVPVRYVMVCFSIMLVITSILYRRKKSIFGLNPVGELNQTI